MIKDLSPADLKCPMCGHSARHSRMCERNPRGIHQKQAGYVLYIRVASYAWYFASVFHNETAATRYARLNYPGKPFKIELGVHP